MFDDDCRVRRNIFLNPTRDLQPGMFARVDGNERQRVNKGGNDGEVKRKT
jgi:hypothetical protein